MKKILLLLVALISTMFNNAMESEQPKPTPTNFPKMVQTPLGRITKAVSTQNGCIQYSLITKDEPAEDYVEHIFHLHPDTNNYCELIIFPADKTSKHQPSRAAIQVPTDVATKTRFSFVEFLFNENLRYQN